jgi:hypothetical protein
MKILDTNDLLEAMYDCGFPDYNEAVDELETVMQKWAERLATHLNIQTGETTWEGKDFGGLCCSFKPAFAGQECPAVIDEGDPGGDWEE